MDMDIRDEQLKTALLRLYSALYEERETVMQPKLLAMSFMRHRVNYKNTRVDRRAIHDDTGIMAKDTFVNGIMAYLITEGKDWFKFLTWGRKFLPSDRIYGANDYLEAAQKYTLAVMSRTKYYTATKSCVEDAVVSGNGYLQVVDDQDKRNVYYMCLDPQEIVGEDDENGVPCIIIRKFTMSGRTAYKKWGDALPEELVASVKNGNGSSSHEFLDAYYPREELFDNEGKPIVTTFKRFAHVVYSYSGDKIIQKGGYDEMPIAVFRYYHSEGCFYGEGKVERHIDELIKLDDMANQRQIIFQKNANPAYNLPLAMVDRRWSDNPGAKNYLDINSGKPEAVRSPVDASYMLNDIKEQQNIVMDLLDAKLFRLLMMSNDIQRTAYEISEQKGEALMLLSVAIGNLQMELITPTVLRTFNILRRMGVIPPVPEELAKESVGGLRVELDGPLVKRMQTYLQATGLVNGLSYIAQVAQINSEIMVNFDWDEIARQGATAQGLPQTAIREYADVQKIKRQQLQQQQQQAQMQQQQADAESIAKLAKANADSGGALAQYLGGM